MSEVWNVMDICAIILYLIGFITRFFVSEALFTVSKYEFLLEKSFFPSPFFHRIFLCLDLILWFVRTLHLFTAYEKLGPKLNMILNTVCI